MAEVNADRIYESSTTTGAGSYTLAGAITGYRAFSAVCANGDTVRCFVEDVDAYGVPNGGWEVGIYTWGTGGVLARTTIEASSNSNAAVSWSAGTRRIGLGVTASKLATFGGGLTYTTEAIATAAPNATVNVVSLSATGGSANVDLALAPKGNGALTMQVADNTTTGGNKRGSAALDLQTKRGASTQVASAQDSIVVGQRCTASGTGAIAIGDTHTVSSPSYGSAWGGFQTQSPVTTAAQSAVLETPSMESVPSPSVAGGKVVAESPDLSPLGRQERGSPLLASDRVSCTRSL